MALTVDIETTDREVAEIAAKHACSTGTARFYLGLRREEICGDCVPTEEWERWKSILREEDEERQRLHPQPQPKAKRRRRR